MTCTSWAKVFIIVGSNGQPHNYLTIISFFQKKLVLLSLTFNWPFVETIAVTALNYCGTSIYYTVNAIT